MDTAFSSAQKGLNGAQAIRQHVASTDDVDNATELETVSWNELDSHADTCVAGSN